MKKKDASEAGPGFKAFAQSKPTGVESDFNATPAFAGRQLFPRSNRTLCRIASVRTAGAGKTR
jgi:hypothetical protein